MKKQVITTQELVTILQNVSGCKFISIAYSSDKDALNKKLSGGKSNEYYNRLQSLTLMSGVQFNANYENAVNNRLKGDGNGDGKGFEAMSLPWGEWVTPNKIISHKGETYVRLYLTKSHNKDVSYFCDGRKVEEKDAVEKIKAAFRQSSPSKRQAEVGIDEADMVRPFTINANSIKQITINGVTYIVAALIV